MKSNEIITNYSEKADEFSSVTAKNYRVIRAGLVDSEYKRRVGSEEIYNASGIRFIHALDVGSFPVLPDAVDGFAYFNFPRPKEWSEGIVGVRWHLTGDTSSTNAVYIRQSMFAFDATSRIGPTAAVTFTPLYSYDVATFTALAMPATNWTRTLFESDVTEYCTVTNEIERIYARLFRAGGNASDSYAGNLLILGAELVYFPKRSQS